MYKFWTYMELSGKHFQLLHLHLFMLSLRHRSTALWKISCSIAAPNDQDGSEWFFHVLLNPESPHSSFSVIFCVILTLIVHHLTRLTTFSPLVHEALCSASSMLGSLEAKPKRQKIFALFNFKRRRVQVGAVMDIDIQNKRCSVTH